MASRVQLVAALLLLLGGVEAASGLLFCGFGLFLAAGAPPALGPLPAEARVAVAVLGPALLAAGILKLVAGLRNLRYRGRLLGLFALASAGVSLFTCCLAPPALALAAFGTAVYLGPGAQRAFQMGEQGLSPEWIRAQLARGREAP